MEERDNNKNKKVPEADNPQPEKKMTKYDRKMEYRKEEEKRSKRRWIISLTALIVLAAVVVGVFAWQAYDNYAENNGDYIMVGDHGIKKAEYDYYYDTGFYNFYLYYGSLSSYLGLDFTQPLSSQAYDDTYTWADYFDISTVESIRQIYALLDAAEEEGFEYDEEDDWQEFVDTMTVYAEEYDETLDEYLSDIYGSGVKLADIEKYVRDSCISEAYYEAVTARTTVTEDEVNDYYEENSDDYDVVDYLICKISGAVEEEETEDDEEEEELTEEEQAAADAAAEEAAEEAMAEAQSKALMMSSQIADEESFAELYAEYAEDDTVEYEKTQMSYSSVSPTDLRTWLFDSEREYGDVDVVEYDSGSCFYVVYFKDRYLIHEPTVDVRHILISAETEDTDEELTEEEEEAALEEAMSEAKEKAEEIYDEWLSGDATEESFAELANQYSDDTGSNTSGGLYEAVAEGEMVENFNDWIFDPSRKTGDTDIVETEYGYHIIYFIGENNESWYVSIESTLIGDKMDEWVSEISDALDVTDKRGHVSYLHYETETEDETEAEENETEAEEETEE